MSDFKFSKKQEERMILLLGSRYKGDGIVKLVVDMYPTRDENLEKAREMMRELYWESLRAPTDEQYRNYLLTK